MFTKLEGRGIASSHADTPCGCHYDCASKYEGGLYVL